MKEIDFMKGIYADKNVDPDYLRKNYMALIRMMNHDDLIPATFIVWTADDVVSKSKSMRVTLTEKEVLKVLDSLYNHLNPNHGVSWETIEYHISETVRRRHP